MKIILLGLIVMMSISGCTRSIKTAEKKDNVVDLCQNSWQFKSTNSEDWIAASVPGTVHTDLLANDRIEDPYYRLNEKKQQWIDKEDWEYKTEFEVSEDLAHHKNMEITFEGLDTYAKVFLNDALVLESDNMFRTYRVMVSGKIKSGKNSLHIVFSSPINKGLELLTGNGYQYPANNDQSENGELGDKRVSPFVRKAPYHFGWDWGPRLVTSGIWKTIYMEAWDEIKIVDLYVKQNNVTDEKAEIEFQTEIEASELLAIDYKIMDETHNKVLKVGKIDLLKGENLIKENITIDNPKLWWPNGYGDQNAYNFAIELSNESKLLAVKKVKTGLRSIKVIRDKDEKGRSFYFEVNGLPIFAKGANYIPNDNFVTRVSDEKYRHILQSAVDANMNMLRIWGGGIYEYDNFYELCDSLGLLVWQDFMFACSMYPGSNKFLQSIELEAIDNVKRLRNHPSIALWCGNNEMEVAWAEGIENAGWGWKQQYNEQQRKVIWHTYDTIFYHILPKVIENNHSEIYYWPSSPIADYKQIASYETTSGDMHYWGVWHGLDKFEKFNEVIPRFMSEYGFQSFPDFASVKKYTKEEDWNIESEVMASHQRSGIGNLRIKEYMGWDYHIPTDFEQFLYVGQVLQAEGMKLGLEAHRRNKPYCMGTLYWQINDCWPVASWSSMDYYGKWKALHYFVKKAYEPYLLSMVPNNENLEVWIISDKQELIDATLEVSLLNFEGDVLYKNGKELKSISDTSYKALSIAIEELKQKGKANSMVLLTELKQGNSMLASNQFYFDKTKNLDLSKASPKFVFNQGKLEITASALIKNLYLFTDDEVVFSDNYFDVLPGKKYLIDVKSKQHATFDLNTVKYISIADTY